jgi:PAS domain S-box-containing protein
MALEDRKAFLDNILNAVASPIFVKNRQHQFVMVNDAFAELAGHPKEKYTGKTDLDFFPAAECRVFREKDEQIFASRQENSNEEEITNLDGEVRTIITKKTIYTDASNRDILVGVINDISARKQLERELQMRIDEIAHKNQQLVNASQSKSEFLASMSHELRTPLNAIIGFSELLKDGLLGDLSAEQVARVTDIFDSGEHLLALINDILDLSKVEAGKMTLELQPVDLAELLDSSLAIIRGPAAEQMITLTLDCAADSGALYADSRKVRQIIYNLLSNAVKFSTAGRIHLDARRVARSSVGRLSGQWPGRCFPLANSEFSAFIEISVSDSGIGMASAAQEQLFLPFSQIYSGPARRFPGTGLGLAMVKRLTDLHGGTVALESAEGIGSRLFVWLPLRPIERLDGGGIDLSERNHTQVPERNSAGVGAL